MPPPHTDARAIARISVARWFDPVISCTLITAAFLTLYRTDISDTTLVLCITFLATGYLFFSEFMRASWKFSAREKNLGFVFYRAVTKFSGVLLGIATIIFAFWLLPEYHDDYKLTFITEASLLFLSVVLPVSFLLIFCTEWILGEKHDGTYQMGLLARGRIGEIEWRTLLSGCLEWLVRGIFLPINLFGAAYFVSRIRENGFPPLDANFHELIMRVDAFIFVVILFAILPGYLFASRLIGTEVKKVDHTWFGWMITLSSYSPLNAAVFSNWVTYGPLVLIYGSVPVWAALTSDVPLLYYAIGIAILFSGLFHLWGEATMGIRSANLSMRGIITTGPFAWTKHPVYVSKCVQWGLIYLPLLNAAGFLNNVRSFLLFLLVCALFAGRAFAEEKLLAEDENYVRYAIYMDDHSLFTFVGRLLPFMSFCWRYEYWKRHGYLD